MAVIHYFRRHSTTAAAIVGAASLGERCLDALVALAALSELLFVISLSVISVALSVAVEYCLEILQVRQSTIELWNHGVLTIFVVAVVLAPPIETLLLQQVPIMIARRLGMSITMQFAVGSIPFAALHFTSGPISGFAGGVVGGLVLSLGYLTFVEQSRVKAFLLTASIHSLHNFVIYIMYVYEKP